LPLPQAGGGAGDDVAVPLGRLGGRFGARPVDHREMDQQIEQAERLIMGDVFLRLSGQDQRQRKQGGIVGHRAPSGQGTDRRGSAAMVNGVERWRALSA
jgi:hypothetical protein